MVQRRTKTKGTLCEFVLWTMEWALSVVSMCRRFDHFKSTVNISMHFCKIQEFSPPMFQMAFSSCLLVCLVPTFSFLDIWWEWKNESKIFAKLRVLGHSLKWRIVIPFRALCFCGWRFEIWAHCVSYRVVLLLGLEAHQPGFETVIWPKNLCKSLANTSFRQLSTVGQPNQYNMRDGQRREYSSKLQVCSTGLLWRILPLLARVVWLRGWDRDTTCWRQSGCTGMHCLCQRRGDNEPAVCNESCWVMDLHARVCGYGAKL